MLSKGESRRSWEQEALHTPERSFRKGSIAVVDGMRWKWRQRWGDDKRERPVTNVSPKPRWEVVGAWTWGREGGFKRKDTSQKINPQGRVAQLDVREPMREVRDERHPFSLGNG